MGLPPIPHIANVVMNHLKNYALTTFLNPPKFYKRSVDYFTFTIIKRKHLKTFFEMINSIMPSLKFTNEIGTDGVIEFLDLIVTWVPGKTRSNGKLITTVYREPTHTNRYIDLESHQPPYCIEK